VKDRPKMLFTAERPLVERYMRSVGEALCAMSIDDIRQLISDIESEIKRRE
jgi:hypothetical protein